MAFQMDASLQIYDKLFINLYYFPRVLNILTIPPPTILSPGHSHYFETGTQYELSHDVISSPLMFLRRMLLNFQSTLVTISTILCKFCHSVQIYFLLFLNNKNQLFPNSSNKLFSSIDTDCLFCDVGTEHFYMI
jgi:hypothetical protein